MLSLGLARRSGELLLGGVPATQLRAAYGTPLLVLDYDAIDQAIGQFESACMPHGIEVAYAGKALLLVSLAAHLKHKRLGLDVCSLGELMTAERAGFPPERITLHGCGKTEAEIDAARSARVGRVVVDNLEELRSFAAHETARPVPILLRINTGIEAHTHRFVHTSGRGSKFGFEPALLPAAIEVLKQAPHLVFEGLHSHIGSQIYEERAFIANAQALMECAASCSAAGLQTKTVIVGGGFGIEMRPGQGEQLDINAMAQAVALAIRAAARQHNLPVPGIGIEPGRAITGAAGTSLYSVLAAKQQFGQPYAIIDGGMYENPRPALYDAYHHTVCASRESTDTVHTIVCGRTCENDRLADADLPRDLAAGDLLAMFSTGAYTYSMAGNYNRFERPAVAAVRQGEHSLIARRETAAELLRNDIDA